MQAQTNPDEDTEFNDALRAHGILPPKPPSRPPTPDGPDASEVRQARLKQATVADLDEEIDRLADNGRRGQDDEEEERLMELRRRRIQDLLREQKRGRFGRVYPIARQDYTREVTEASKESAEGTTADETEEEEQRGGQAKTFLTSSSAADEDAPSVTQDASTEKPLKGTGVVCFLYKDGMDTCRLLAGYLDTLAAKYPSTKFVSIVGDKCIPNYPDKNLPTMLIYRNGELHRQIIGLRPEIGLDGLNTKLEDIELLLLAVGVIERSRIPGASSYEPGLQFNDVDAKTAEREEDRDEDEGFGGNRAKVQPTIRSQEELDDELDWD